MGPRLITINATITTTAAIGTQISRTSRRVMSQPARSVSSTAQPPGDSSSGDWGLQLDQSSSSSLAVGWGSVAQGRVRDVVATEFERVVDGGAQLHFAGGAGHDVELHTWIEGLQIQGRGHHTVSQRQHVGQAFDRAGGSEQMTQRTLAAVTTA
jgi:hypothetical protein